MALLRYFKVSTDAAKLPDPRGPLSTKVPSSSVGKRAAENGVAATMRFWRSQAPSGIVGGAVLEGPSAKIRLRNLCGLPFRENWIPRKFPAIR